MNEGLLGFPRGYGLTPNQPGFDALAVVKFRDLTEFIIDNCFTPTYAFYRLMVDFSSWSSTTTIIYQFRSSGNTYTSADYDTQIASAASGTVAGTAATAGTSARIGSMYATPGVGSFSLDIVNPQRDARTTSFSQAVGVNSTTNVVWESTATQMRVNTAMQGIRLTSANGLAVFTGTARVYGYRLP